ncbi:uncharacterized protein SOCE26_016890 [Sorangium cellulosum]|uniref:Uncharacterized protein n=1 Tax=Sorangium cellulosum TaxID=56 RepID=A0A2L0ELX1_SORCE|nr:hypothetical protein [Sorangium cellulosum]AUX40289.1 uncharacterized protein SOCE26_016890 [Sorangium cellulosum]
MSKRSALLGGLLLATCFLTWFLWWYLDRAPLVWSALLWAGVLLILFFARAGGERLSLWVNAAALLLAVAFAEGFLWIRQATNPYLIPSGVTFEGSFTTPNYFFVMPEAVLGYRPRPGVSVQSIKKYFGKLVYDVHYTVGDDGLRVSPPVKDAPVGCILFFGDSFAWGEAVQDSETTAYQLGVLSGGTHRVYNFAFTGYGAHQMLAQLQRGIVKGTVACKPDEPVYAVYQALPNNVGRVAGLGGWDKFGPRYVLLKDGRVMYKGRFDQGDAIADDRWYVKPGALRWLAKTQVYQRTLGRARSTNGFDDERFFAVVERSARTLEQQFPRAKLFVIVWEDLDERRSDPGSLAWRMWEGLKQRGLDARLVKDTLPGYEQNRHRYHVENDAHPSAEAHRLLAAYLYEQLNGNVHSRND